MAGQPRLLPAADGAQQEAWVRTVQAAVERGPCAAARASASAAAAAPPPPPTAVFNLRRDGEWDALVTELRERFAIFGEVGSAAAFAGRRGHVGDVAADALAVLRAAGKFKTALRLRPRRPPTDEHGAAVVFQRLLRGRVQRHRFRKTLKRARQRVRVLEEILATELTYARNLRALVTVALAPLRWNAEHAASAESRILSPEEVDTVFRNAEQIAGLAAELVGRLEARLERITAHARLGDVFLDIAPFFRIYSEYMNGFDDARRLLVRAQARPLWQVFWQQCQRHPDMGGMDLNSFLIMPVQRVPRYVLLLKELRKNTTLDDDEHDALGRALELVEAVACQINANMREEELVADMLRCEQHFGDHVSILEPHRRLASHGPVEWVRENRVLDPAELFLFNDLVVLARPLGADRFAYEAHAALTNSTHVVDLPGADGAFRLVSAHGVFTLVAESREAKLLWVSAVEELVAHLRRARPSVALEPVLAVVTEVKPGGDAVTLAVRRNARRRAVTKTFAEVRHLHSLLSHSYEELPPAPPRHAAACGKRGALMLGQCVQALLLRTDVAADPDVRAFLSWPAASGPLELPDGEFELVFGPGRLGLKLETGFNLSCIAVRGCEPGSLAASMPELRRDLVLTAVNEAPLPADFAEAMGVLRSTVRPFKLRFRDDSLHYRDMLWGHAESGDAVPSC